MEHLTEIRAIGEPRGRAVLRYTTEGIEHETLIEVSPFTIGRLPDRDLVMQAGFVSRQHAEIVQQGTSFILRDMGSKGGCFVNGRSVNEHVLRDADVIQIGSPGGLALQFRLQTETTTLPLRTLLGHIQEKAGAESGLGRLHWFLEAARRLNDRGAIQEIIGVLIESTLQLTCAERGFVYLRRPGGSLDFVAGRDAQGATLPSDAGVSRSAIQQAIASQSAVVVTDTLTEEGFEPSASVLAQDLRLVICLPLRQRGAEAGQEGDALLGVLYLDSQQQRCRLTQVDSTLLDVIAAEAAALVENSILAEAEKAARQVRTELKIAAQIQRGLMAVQLPHLQYASVDADSLPCKEIGGDFFDVLVREGGLNVVVADVSGKGVSAALLGAMLQGLVHAQLLAGKPLAQIAASANEFLCGRELGKYATLVLLRVEPDGHAEYINCGHVQPLRQCGPRVSTLTNSNLPVGLIAAAHFGCESLQLQPAERILVVTDGLTEAENPDGDCFGDLRLQASVLRGATLPEILQELREFTFGRPLEDDCTALEVRFQA